MVNFSFTSKDKKAQTVLKDYKVFSLQLDRDGKAPKNARDAQRLNHYFITTTIGKKKTVSHFETCRRH